MNTSEIKTVKVIAERQHAYDGIDRKAGEVYEVTEEHAKLLRTAGTVRLYESKDMKAADSEPEGVNSNTRDKYKRRDMRAQK